VKKHKKKIIKDLIITLVIVLLLGINIFGIVYRYSYGFTEFDHPSPRRRYFDSLEELKEATKGKYLFPDYITPEIDPALNPDITEGYTLYAGYYSGLGDYGFGYVFPNELIEELIEVVEDLSMVISFASRTYRYPIREKDDIKEIELSRSTANFFYQDFTDRDYSFPWKRIILEFIGTARKSYGNYVSFIGQEEKQYFINFRYICNNPKNEEEFIEYLESELIKIAESMLEQGLPDRK